MTKSPNYWIWTKLNKIFPDSLFANPTQGWVGLSKQNNPNQCKSTLNTPCSSRADTGLLMLSDWARKPSTICTCVLPPKVQHRQNWDIHENIHKIQRGQYQSSIWVHNQHSKISKPNNRFALKLGHPNLKSYFFCELKQHVKFQNPAWRTLCSAPHQHMRIYFWRTWRGGSI